MITVSEFFRLARSRTQRSFAVAWMLAEREVVAEFRTSRLSIAWPLIYPLSYTALFAFVRPALNGAYETPLMSFVVFVFVGFGLWQTWFEAMRSQMDAVRKNKSLMTRAELGSATLFLLTFIVTGLHMLPRVLLSIVLALFIFPIGPVEVLVFIVASFFLLLNGSVIGAILQPFSTLSPDLGKAIQSVSLALLVTGAVFLPVSSTSSFALKLAVALNPLGALLNAARAPLMAEPLLNVTASVAWCIATTVLAALVFALGRRVLPILMERIGN